MLLLSHFSRVRLCTTPSLGFSRQEHWCGLPFPSPMHKSEKWKWSRSVMSDSSRPHGLQPTRLLRPWDFPGKSTGVGCHCLPHQSAIKRNNSICSNMSGSRDCHTEWNKSEKDKYHIIFFYMWNLKKSYKWTYVQNGNSHSSKNKLMATKTERRNEDKLGGWGWHIHTAIYKTDSC